MVNTAPIQIFAGNGSPFSIIKGCHPMQTIEYTHSRLTTKTYSTTRSFLMTRNNGGNGIGYKRTTITNKN